VKTGAGTQILGGTGTNYIKGTWILTGGTLELQNVNLNGGDLSLTNGNLVLRGTAEAWYNDLAFGGTGTVTIDTNAALYILQANYSLTDAATDIAGNKILGLGGVSLQAQTFNDGSADWTVIIPEPSAFVLVLAGLGGVALLRRRRQ
jgi:hypothetical protein